MRSSSLCILHIRVVHFFTVLGQPHEETPDVAQPSALPANQEEGKIWGGEGGGAFPDSGS